jgi:PAS domain S-box-containing protein
MNPLSSPYTVFMITAAIICMSIAVYVWPRRRSNSETVPLILLLLGITEWIVAALLGLVDQNLAHKILWAKIEYFGVVSVPLMVLVYVLYHSGSNQWLTVKRLAWLVLIPVATLILAWTNEGHGLIWAKYIPYRENGLVLSDKTYGFGFWIYWVYSYLVLLIATVLSIRLSLASSKIFRWQSILIVTGILMPWAGNLLYVLHINPFGNLDLTPLAFSITGVMLAIGMFRWQLFDIKPIAQAAAITGMADGLLILDNQDRIVDVNPAAQVILGLDLQELVGKQMERIVPGWLPFNKRPDRTNGKSMELKLRGSVENRDYEISDSPFYEEPGVPGGRIVFLHDTTDRKRLEEKLREMERKHAEEALREGKEKYRLLFENIMNGFALHEIILNDEGKPIDYIFLEVNEAFEQSTGLERENIIGKKATDVIPGIEHDPADWIGRYGEVALTGEETRFEQRSEYIGKWYSVLAFSPQTGQFATIFEDITERKEAENVLRKTQEQLMLAIRSANVGLWDWDLQSNEVYYSPEWKRQLGYEDHEISNDFSEWESRVHPEDLERAKGTIHTFLDNPYPNYYNEFRMQHKDGSYRWILAQASLINDDQGRPIHMIGSHIEITGSKRAEEKLRASETRYRELFNNINSGVAVYEVKDSGRDFVFKDFNRAGERIDHDNRERLIGKSIFEVRPGVEEFGLIDVFRKVWQTGRPAHHPVTLYEDRHLVGWYENYVYKILPNEIVTVFENVTERKRAEEKLRESEKKYRDLINGMNDTVWVIDFDTTILDVNNTAINVLGYSREELLSMKISDIDVDMTPEQIQGLASNMPKDQVQVFETWHTTKDGRKLPVEVSSSLVSYAGKTVVMSITRDITKRKKAEEALRRSEDKYSKAFDASPNVLVISRLADGLIIETNNSWERLFGYSREETIGQSSLELGLFVNPADRQLAATQLRVQGYVHDFEIEIRHKSGEVRQAILSLELIEIENEPCMLTIIHDITERKKYEKELQTLNTELEQRVAARTEQLVQTNIELEHANRAKDEFLATMSHELRTPLNSILGLSETLLERRSGSLNAKQKEFLQTIETSGHHLLELINDVLDLSKIEAGKLDFYPQVVDIDALCRSSLGFVKEQAMRKSITISHQNDGTDTRIYADPRRLKQILVNLLTNAVKFTPEHGQVELQVHTNVEDDLIQLSVTDNGIGIAPEDLQRLFQPFVQVDSSLNRQFEGTGLGLALVQKLTDMHGGSVQVESEVGIGSRFTINLPWRKDIAAQQEIIESGGELQVGEGIGKAKSTSRGTFEHGKVLLVEDNMANILTMGDYLKNHGYQVAVAHDGLEAIEKAEETDPRVILMDIQMPAMDGLEAIHRLRRNPRFKTTPIIALTALAMPGDRERCLEAGADEYMSKPVSLKELVKTINELSGPQK